MINSNLDDRLTAEDILKNEKIKTLLRDELGMYNVEQSLTAKAIELTRKLQRIDKFEQKKHEQKVQFVCNDAFPLALMLAKADYSLSGDKILYWEKMMNQFISEKPVRNNIRRRPRRRN
jgi:formyltetrahydrofolate synthetase